jgi:sugar phosphate isomerase/epimerase
MFRRSFIKTTGVLATGALLPGLSSAGSLFTGFAAKYPPVGLQMYTLNFLLNAKDSDTRAVLKQIADIGIKELESATGADGLYYGHKPKEFAAMIKDQGLKWIGNHIGGLPRTAAPRPAGASAPAQTRTPARNLRDNLQQIVDDAAEGGCSWVVCASSSETTLDEIKRTTEVFVKAAEAAKKNKMKFAYHNHQDEFKKIEGTSAYEYILGQTNKNEVYMELDLAWATAAGMDPVAMFKQYPGRFPLWHVKDLDKTTGNPCPVGKGKVNFKPIFENRKLSGVQHTFIEQDGAKTIEDPASSVQWLKANIYT